MKKFDEVNKLVVEVVSVNGGWTTVRSDSGKEYKVRNGQLSDNLPKAKTESSPRKHIEAGFIGEREPGKKGKIVTKASGKTTEFSLDRYYVSDVRTESGRRTVDCADSVAVLLRGKTIEQVREIVGGQMGIPPTELEVRYAHLNNGMQRMTLSNMFRKFLREQKED